MLEVKHLVKTYSPKGGVTVRALDDVSIVFPEKGMVFLLGKSGSGKSTLLNVAGGLDKADSGEIIVKGKSSNDFSASDFDSYRNTCVGFVFQEYNLLSEFSVEQNVALALELQNKKNDKAAVNALLERVDLKGLGRRKPSTLSGGQKQRVAIARALIKEPEIIMADEPTGALDSTTGRQILDTFKKLSKEKLVVIVSHDREFAEHYADRIIELADGKIVSDVSKTYSEPIELENNVRVVAGDTVTIEDADKLDENDLKKILGIIRKNGGKAIIATDERKIENVKKACKINEDGSAESFETTKPTETVEYDGKSTKFIKSKLPASHAFRIGASGLKTKPIRLVFTALLSVVAFSLFGVLSAFMTYDRDFSFSKALQKTGNPAAKVVTQYEETHKTITVNTSDGSETVKTDVTYGSNISVSKNDLKKLNDNNVNVKFAGVFGLSESASDAKTDIGVQVSDNDYYPMPYFTGFSDCGAEFLESCGYTLSAGRYPENKNEIAVTEYVDGLFKAAGKGSATDNAVKINIRVLNEAGGGGAGYKYIDVDLKIVGVYKTKAIDKKFDALKKTPDTMTMTTSENRSDLIASFKDYLKNSFNLIAFVSPDFYESYVEKDEHPYDFSMNMHILGVEISNEPISGNVYYYYLEAYTARFVSYYSDSFVFFDLDGNEIKNFDVNNLKLGVDEIYAPLEILYDSEGTLTPNTENDNKIRYFKNYNGKSGTLNVKGYYAVRRSKGPTFSYSRNMIVSEEFIKKYASNDSYSFSISTTKYKPTGGEIYRYALATTDNSLEQTSYILNGEPERDVVRTIDCEAYRGISLLVSLIEELSNVFLIAGLILGVFAALLLLNFISASISAKSKEIGILRAVGARGSDVFKIFFSEAFIFAFICFILSSIGSAWLCNVINSSILHTTVVPTAELLNYNVLNIAFTLVVSLVVCALATFLPVFNAARKPPVEVSRG